ncbi:FAP402B [Auxenochlorella protothecoides x Auxenochlorella symbiontica]
MGNKVSTRTARRSSQKHPVPSPGQPGPAPSAPEEDSGEAQDGDEGYGLRFESCPIIRSASQASLSDKAVSDYETFMHRQLELNEARRSEILASLGVDFHTPQNRFDNITALVKSIFGVGLSTVSIIEGDMAYFMSRAGDWAPGAPRKMTLCQCLSACNDSKLLVVENVQMDPRFMNNPFVKGPPNISFYAGAPLISSFDGSSYGTLCLVDFKPRSFPPHMYAILAQFAEIVTRELERDKVLALQKEAITDYALHRNSIVQSLDAVVEPIVVIDTGPSHWPVVYMNPPAGELTGCQAFVDYLQPELPSFWSLFRLAEDDTAPPAGSGARGGEAGGGGAAAAASESGSGTPSMRQLAAAQAAAATLEPFSLRVVPRRGAATRGGSGSMAPSDSVGGSGAQRDGDGGGPGPVPDDPRSSGPAAAGASASNPHTASSGVSSGSSAPGGPASAPILLDLKPAHTSHLRSGATPDLGIPVVREDSLDSASDTLASYSELDPAAVAAATAHAALGSLEGPRRETMYFCVARRADAPPPGARAPSGAARERLAGSMVAAIASGMDAALVAETPVGGLAASRRLALPAHLFAQRPGLMREVTLGCLIGVGSSGRTYRGMWHGGRVAVKIVECWADPGAGALLRQRSVEVRAEQDTHAAVVEAALGRALAHPHIVPTYAYAGTQGEVDARGLVHSATWIVQAFCSRGSLIEAVQRGDLAQDGQPNLRAILSTAGEIAGALAYLHSCGIIHGDLSGNNVLLTAQPNDARRWVAMVSDFGLSRIRGMQSVHSAPHGTVTHMPPELLRGGPMTHEVDVWSFGTLLWEMCAGKRAWDTLSYHQVLHALVSEGQTLPVKSLSGVPPLLQELMASCLATDPNDRPSFARIGQKLGQMARAQRPRSSQ